MKTVNYKISINSPLARVRKTMLDHPTYEQRTEAFAPWSTYEGSWEQWSRIAFIDPTSKLGMFAEIAENRLHEFVSIRHLGELGLNPQTDEREEKPYPNQSYENYTFTQTADGTQVDVSLDQIPDERVEWMDKARPQALLKLKEICE